MATTNDQTPRDPKPAAKLDSPSEAKGAAPAAPKGAKDSQTPRDPEAAATLDSPAGAKGVQDVPLTTSPDQRKAEAKRRAARDDSGPSKRDEKREEAKKDDDTPGDHPMVAALLIERDGLAAAGKHDRIAQVDEQLQHYGYDPKRKAAERRAAATGDSGDAPKGRQTPQQRTAKS